MADRVHDGNHGRGPVEARVGFDRRLGFRLTVATAALALISATLAVVGPVTGGRQADPTPDQHRVVDPGSSHPVAEISGRGWGHGRGMGQHGALGYSQDQGWNAARILDHYYGGTTSGPVPTGGSVDSGRLRVELIHMTGRPTVVALVDGTLSVTAADGTALTSLGSGALRLTAVAGGFEAATAPGCEGPWTAAPGIEHATVRIEAESSASGRDGLIQVCGPSHSTWYDGDIQASVTADRQRTVNVVTVEQYLRGVVPNEVPALWPSPVLEAQAVAARSYALSPDPRSGSHSDTCDTVRCQVYDGRFTTRGGLRQATHPRTDAAVAATAGTVRLKPSGAVARTEFSSSTGGYTAGGDFPAVIDEGDAVEANASSTWSAIVDLSPLERSTGKGPLEAIDVTGRNGLGADGGRVTEVVFRFRDGSVRMTGQEARSRLGIRSDWFVVGRITRGDVVVDDPDQPPEIVAFIDGAFRTIGGRPPTDREREDWRTRLAGEDRLVLSLALARGDHFTGELIDDLYRDALGRPADGTGRAYWVRTMADGLHYEHLGTLFFGSPEYVKRAGGTHQAFVSALYRDVLGRGADRSGLAYWTGLLDQRSAAPADVAAAFFRGIESRRDRGRALHRRLFDGEPSADQVDRLADRLVTLDDIELAARMVAEAAP